MPYLTCPGCSVRQYSPPLHVRRRSCPVCDTELSAGSLLRRPAERDRSRLVHYLVQLLGDRDLAERVVCECFAQPHDPSGAPSARAAVYRIVHQRAVGLLRNGSAAASPGGQVPARQAAFIEDLQALGFEQRAALVLRTAGALSHEEVAHVLDLGVARTQDMLVAARVALAEAGEARNAR